MLRALRAEITKLRRSRVLMWTALAVLVWPSVTDVVTRIGGGSAESLTWDQFMLIGTQGMTSWYGVPLFGFVTAYVFGREFSEQTARNLLTLPVRREYFIASKLVVTIAWAFGLAVLSVAAHAGYAAALGLVGFSWANVTESLSDSLLVTFVIAATLPLIGLLSMAGRGYLLPMMFSALAFVSGIVLLPLGAETWFPWSMPSALLGVFWIPGTKTIPLVASSWVALGVTFVLGVAAILIYIDWADNLE